MTATDRARRQSITDHAGRPARIEAVTRDLRADLEHEGHKIIEAEGDDYLFGRLPAAEVWSTNTESEGGK